MSLHIKFWGVRGNLPTPQSPNILEVQMRETLYDFFKKGFRSKDDIENFLTDRPLWKKGGYGGNSTCMELYTDRHQLIIDAGSGLARLGDQMMSGPCGRGNGEVHLIITHFHWDHIIGLLEFAPLFVQGNKIHVYSVHPETEEVFRATLRKPFFPLPFENIPAEFIFYQLEGRAPVQLGDLVLAPYELDHPDPCWGFRAEYQGKVLSYCVDTESTRASREQLGADLPLYQGVDLMIFDAQYTIKEEASIVDWGHASASIGLDIAIREGIKKIIFTHFDPRSSDERINEAMDQTQYYFETLIKHAEKEGRRLKKPDVEFAREGKVYTFG